MNFILPDIFLSFFRGKPVFEPDQMDLLDHAERIP